MKTNEVLGEKWSAKYKRSIDCNNPKGFSQRAHCQGRKKNESLNEDIPPMSELVAMATVASVSVPVLKAMLKAAYKTGKGLLQLKRIANKAGVKLADRIVGEDEEQELPIDMDQIRDFILELESKGHLKPEEADDLRRATQALASGRDTILPNRILQLLTLISR